MCVIYWLHEWSKSKIKPQNPGKEQKKKKKTKQKQKTKKQSKDILKVLNAFFDGRERVIYALESKVCQREIQSTDYSDFDHFNPTILSPKQMLQRLPIALALVKAGNTLAHVKT